MATPGYPSDEQVDRWLQLLEKCQATLTGMADRLDKASRAHLAPPQSSPPAHPARPAPVALPAALPAAPSPAPLAATPPELPPQPITAPVPARSYPPSPSVETIDEVEQKQVYKPLRNIRKQLGQKHRASKTVSIIRVSKFFEDCTGWPPKFGGIDMRFSRDEEADAWYTTMLNHEALPNQV